MPSPMALPPSKHPLSRSRRKYGSQETFIIDSVIVHKKDVVGHVNLPAALSSLSHVYLAPVGSPANFALRQPDLALVIGPQQREQPRIERALGAVLRFLRRERDGAAHDFGLQLNLRVLLEKRAGEERLFGARPDHDAAMTAHLRHPVLAERPREIGRLRVGHHQPRVVPGRHAGAQERPVQKNRHHRLAGDAERPRVGRMQVHHAHGVGTIAMDLGVDTPLQRNQSAGMLDDGAVDIVDEDLLWLDRALVRAGARTDEAPVGVRHADRDVPEHPDRALQIEHPRQRRGFFAQHCVLTHAKRNLPMEFGLELVRADWCHLPWVAHVLVGKRCALVRDMRCYCDLARPARSIRSPQRSISAARNFCSSQGAGLSTGIVPSLTMTSRTSGAAVAAVSSACRRSMIGLGVADGAQISVQPTASKPGTPASAMLGTSGMAGTRVGDDTPRARTRPAEIGPTTVPASANITATWPAMTSFRAGGAPR